MDTYQRAKAYQSLIKQIISNHNGLMRDDQGETKLPLYSTNAKGITQWRPMSLRAR